MQKQALPSFFEKPSGPVDVLIIAGEHSGDEHAAMLVEDLLKEQPNLNISAIGGPCLQQAGAQLLFNMTESSVVGLVEVLRHYPFFKKIFDLILNWIEEHKPKCVCFIDYPGFNLRLAKALYNKKLAKKSGGDITLAYYIGPQVWAWKAKRRFSMAKHLDALAVILPFEKQFFSDTTLPVTFVGHPFAQKDHDLKLSYDPNAPILLLPGSRKTPVRRMLPILIDSFKLIHKESPGAQGIILYPSKTIRSLAKTILEKYPSIKGNIALKPAEEKTLASATLMSSGTMSLKCALAKIPGAIIYKANALTYIIGRIIVTIKYLGLSNLILDKPMHPEYIQHAAKPKVLASYIKEITTKEKLEAFNKDAKQLHQLLSESAEMQPAPWLLSLL